MLCSVRNRCSEGNMGWEQERLVFWGQQINAAACAAFQAPGTAPAPPAAQPRSPLPWPQNTLPAQIPSQVTHHLHSSVSCTCACGKDQVLPGKAIFQMDCLLQEH